MGNKENKIKNGHVYVKKWSMTGTGADKNSGAKNKINRKHLDKLQ